MKPLGTIVRLQLQRSDLKIGPRGRKAYEPAPIISLPAIAIDRGGVTGWDDDGQTMLDVHHCEHPSGKNHDGLHGFSVLFTPHYTAMRRRFGSHLTEGIAGESILVETDRIVSPDDLHDGLAIQAGDDLARLQVTKIAEPCVEFTRFAIHYPPDARADHTLTDALNFLRAGMRGFYLRYEGKPLTVRLGDRVYL